MTEEGYFGAQTDKNIDQVNVQNRIALATPRLPTTVQQLGVTAQTASTSILLVYTFYSENNEYDPLFISNYIDFNLRDQLLRTPGVGDLTIMEQAVSPPFELPFLTFFCQTGVIP